MVDDRNVDEERQIPTHWTAVEQAEIPGYASVLWFLVFKRER